MNQSAESSSGVTIEQPIRWGDLDSLGHVNNIIFFQFCESARIAYFERIELDRFKRKATDGPGLVAAKLNFRRQLRYPGTVAVSANVTRIGGKAFTLSYAIRDVADGEIAADGDSVCVWVDYQAGRAMPLPEPLIEKIRLLERDDRLGRIDPPS